MAGDIGGVKDAFMQGFQEVRSETRKGSESVAKVAQGTQSGNAEKTEVSLSSFLKAKTTTAGRCLGTLCNKFNELQFDKKASKLEKEAHDGWGTGLNAQKGQLIVTISDIRSSSLSAKEKVEILKQLDSSLKTIVSATMIGEKEEVKMGMITDETRINNAFTTAQKALRPK